MDAINASLSRSESTMDAIKAYMLANNLRPGDPLPTEAALCNALGVSRSSVREALRKLEALDVVRVRQGRGSVVGDMTLDPLVDTLMLRVALDSSQSNVIIRSIAETRVALDFGVAEQLTIVMKDTENPHLRDLVAKMEEKTEHGLLFPDEDIAFHTGLLSNLNNPVLVELMRAMWFVHQTLLPNLDLSLAKERANLLKTARAHGHMLDAAEAGDLQGYIAAVREHYQPLQHLLQSNPGTE